MTNIIDSFISDIDKIDFLSLSSGKHIPFKAFLTNFSDDYECKWKSQEIFGRMDPIYTFQSTTRKITISFDVPSYSTDDAIENYKRINELMEGLYPIYEDNKALGAAYIKSPPMFAIKFANFIQNEDGTALLGWISGYDFKPEAQSGFFTTNDSVVPKLFKVNIVFNVIHSEQLGNQLPVAEQKAEAVVNNTPQATKKQETQTQPLTTTPLLGPGYSPDVPPVLALMNNKQPTNQTEESQKKAINDNLNPKKDRFDKRQRLLRFLSDEGMSVADQFQLNRGLIPNQRTPVTYTQKQQNLQAETRRRQEGETLEQQGSRNVAEQNSKIKPFKHKEKKR